MIKLCLWLVLTFVLFYIMYLSFVCLGGLLYIVMLMVFHCRGEYCLHYVSIC